MYYKVMSGESHPDFGVAFFVFWVGETRALPWKKPFQGIVMTALLGHFSF